MDESLKRQSIAERLQEFFRRLIDLPPAATASEAFRQVCDTLEAVEDELSGITKQIPPPPPNKSDGRMYVPLEDFVHRRSDGSMQVLTRGHVLEFDASGGYLIRDRNSGNIRLEKRGFSE